MLQIGNSQVRQQMIIKIIYLSLIKKKNTFDFKCMFVVCHRVFLILYKFPKRRLDRLVKNNFLI
jgi:hypothetical protein